MAHYKGIRFSIMSSHLSQLLVWTALLLLIVSRCTVHCVLTTPDIDVNATSSGEGIGFSAIKDIHELNLEGSEDEYHDENFSIRGFIIDDDSILVQPVIKPENTEGSSQTTKKKGDRKKGEKKKKKGQKKKKKDNPCLTTHKKFCIHGECKWLANLQEVTCKCKPNYHGERCMAQSMKTGKQQFDDMTTTTVLAVVAVLLSLISVIAIIIIIVVHTRRKYSSYHCEAEEKKRLGHENGSDEVDV